MKTRDYSLYIAPYSAADEDAGTGGMDALDDILNQMDANDTPPEDNDAGNEPDEQQGTEQPPQRTQQDKQQYAFAQLRSQNGQLTDLLGKIANANGIEYSNHKDLIAKLNDSAIEKMAQKQNVPVELIRELEALKADSQAFKQQQLRDAAAVGFQNVMDAYGLTQEQLQEFAAELDKEGKNPFLSPINLMQEYKIMHYDDILKAEVRKAVEEALKNDNAANNSSTLPGKQGSSGSGDAKITTVSELTALLNEVK